MNYLKFAFPFTYALNMFSVTGLIVLLGFFSQSEVAADAAIVHAATLVAFMAFSGNARNIILSQDEAIPFNQLLKFRLILLLPLSCVAYFLCYGVISPEPLLVNALILRRALEWLLELQISERELKDDLSYAKKYSLTQGVFVGILSVLILFDQLYWFYIALNIWAITPIIFCYKLIKDNFYVKGDYKSTWKRILPHIGSSWIIACSAYIFRLLIILLAGKATAGVLFSAYAIGGMMNSIYTYAVGPSMARLINGEGVNNEKKYTFIVISLLAVIGLMLVTFSSLTGNISIAESENYYFPIGLSLIGGAIMIVAQRQRIHILQIEKNNVFVPDVIINILIISSVPFGFYLLGNDSLMGLFLWSSILTFFIYKIPSIGSSWIKDKFSSSVSEKLIATFDRGVIQSIILFFLFLPIFFQLNGDFLFNSKDLVFDHGGKLSNLPLPYSLIACLLGLILLMRKNKSETEAGVLFAFFILMMFSVYMTSFGNQDDLLNKIIFLIQFILPVFALILGRSYIEPHVFNLGYQSIFLLVLILIIPTQTLLTVFFGFGNLVPSIGFFSVYQHMQYVPTILVGVYGVLVFSDRNKAVFKEMLLILFPFVWGYSIFSSSITALILILSITVYLFFIFLFSKKYTIWHKSFLPLTFLVFTLTYHDALLSIFAHESGLPYFIKKIAFSGNGLFENIAARIHIWEIFSAGVFEDWGTFWLGHSERMSKIVASSAHNYYLDLIYHFGIVSLLPILYLIIITIYKFIKLLPERNISLELFGLFFFVMFLLFIDNSLKVGLRQPYPGLISFFFWGVLLSKLDFESKNKKTK